MLQLKHQPQMQYLLLLYLRLARGLGTAAATASEGSAYWQRCYQTRPHRSATALAGPLARVPQGPLP